MSYQSRVAAEKFNQILKDTLSSEHYTDTNIAQFISNYVTCKDIKEAAKKSGLTNADGRYLYNQPDIYKCIEVLLNSEIVKYGYNAHEVVERTKEIAYYDPADVYDDNGHYYKNINDIPAETRRAIKEITVKNTYGVDHNGVQYYTGEIIKIVFHDKMKGLEMIAREKDTFKKTTVVEHEIGKNGSKFLLAAVGRATEAVARLEAPAAEREVDAIDVEPVTVSKIPKPPGVM